MESPDRTPCCNDHCREERGDRRRLIFSVSPRRDSNFWLIFHLSGRSSPRAGTACSLAAAGRAELEVPGSSAWRRSSPPTTACLGNFISLPPGLRAGDEKSQEAPEEWK